MVIMDLSRSFDLVPHQRLLSKLRHFGITREAAQEDPKFSNENTAGCPRECFFLIYNSNAMSTTRDGFWPPTFILCLSDFPEEISSQVSLLADDSILCC